MSRVYDQRACRLGEGPIWHPERNQLFWFDILRRKLMSREAGRAFEWQFDEMVSAAGGIDYKRLLIASDTRFFSFDVESGRRDDVAPLEADNPATRSNDGRADPWGGFWIGTMGKKGECGAGAIYRLYCGEIRQLFRNITIPNAICFAPNRSVAYFTDTPTRKVMAQPLDAEGWPQGAPRVFLDLTTEAWFPDGAVTDVAGNFWVAQWGAARVAAYAPDGTLLTEVPVGAVQTTCPAFGGRDFCTLFITTAQKGLKPEVFANDSLAGRVLSVRSGACGRPEYRVRL